MTKKQKHKLRKKREKNRLRLRHLWQQMTRAEREDACKQTLPEHLWAARFWERVWALIPQIWQSDIGRAPIPRRLQS